MKKKYHVRQVQKIHTKTGRVVDTEYHVCNARSGEVMLSFYTAKTALEAARTLNKST